VRPRRLSQSCLPETLRSTRGSRRGRLRFRSSAARPQRPEQTTMRDSQPTRLSDRASVVGDLPSRLSAELNAISVHYGPTALRLSIGLVFLWFGVLKFFPSVSPAEDIAVKTLTALTLGQFQETCCCWASHFSRLRWARVSSQVSTRGSCSRFSSHTCSGPAFRSCSFLRNSTITICSCRPFLVSYPRSKSKAQSRQVDTVALARLQRCNAARASFRAGSIAASWPARLAQSSMT